MGFVIFMCTLIIVIWLAAISTKLGRIADALEERNKQTFRDK